MYAILFDIWLSSLAPVDPGTPLEAVPYVLDDPFAALTRRPLPTAVKAEPDFTPPPPPKTGPAPPPPVLDPFPITEGRGAGGGSLPLPVGVVKSQLSFLDPKGLADPMPKSPSWDGGHQLRVPVSGDLHLFGQFNAGSPAIEQQQVRWSGRTGVGYILRPVTGFPGVQVRAGQGVTKPPNRHWVAERSEFFLEMTTKLAVPLLDVPFDVEYSGVALPALTPADHDRVSTDIRVALPMTGGKFHVGARWTTDDAPTTAPWVERAQLYLGLDLKR